MSIRVLIVEDHPVTRAGLRAFLEGTKDIEVVAEAECGSDVLELIRSSRPDVVLLDCRLPDMPGEAIAGEIKRQGLPGAVLAFSAFSDKKLVARMMQSGASGYILKAEPPQNILEAIRTVAGGGYWISPRLAGAVAVGREARGTFPGDLTHREWQVLALLAQGKGNTEIADELNISYATVKTDLNVIYSKLGVDSRASAVS